MAENPYDQFVAVPNPYDKFTRATRTANPTSVSATPTGPMAAIRQFGVDVAGNTAERARRSLEALEANQAKYRKPGLAAVLEAYNPLNRASDVGNALGVILAPVSGLGDTIGTRIDPVYGKPGSGGGEQRKYGDVLELATPLPGAAAVKGGKAIMGAVDLAGALAAARKARGAVGGVVSVPFKATKRVLDAGKTAKTTAAEAEAALTATRDTGAQYLQQAIMETGATRKRQATLAATLSKRGETAQAASVPPIPGIGTRAQLSDIGDVVRTPAQANEVAINAQMKQADETYRTAMNQVAADRAAAGVGVSDAKAAQEQIKQSKAIVTPSAGTRPSVGFVPADSAGAKLHKMALEVLEPKRIPITRAEAFKLRNQGVEVGFVGGQHYRIIKPDLAAVDNFRRFVGKVQNGKIEGYEAINAVEAGNMYGNLSKIIDEYVAGASAPVQANWKAGKAALEPFEKVKAGKTLVGTQKGTDVEMVPASAIPGRMVGGGRDTFQQTTAVAGPEATGQALRSIVQNKLLDASGKPVTAAKASELIAPGTPLAENVSLDPALSAEVRRYITQLQDAEMAGVEAPKLFARATTAQKTSDAAKKERVILSAELRGLKGKTNLSEAVTKTDSIVMELVKNEKITPAQQDAYLAIKSKAEDAIEIADTAAKAKVARDNFVKSAAAALGLTTLGLKATEIISGSK